MKNIYLASKSPRRYEILTNLGFEVKVIDSLYEEDNNLDMDPIELAKYHAKEKGFGALVNMNEDGIIVSGDTFVVLENEVLCKPKDRIDAFNILKKLSGKTHRVVSGVCVIDFKSKDYKVLHDETKVTFIELSDKVIERYLDVAEYMDKAGAYAIQFEAGSFVLDIQGSYTNILGLPSDLVLKMIKEVKK